MVSICIQCPTDSLSLNLTRHLSLPVFAYTFPLLVMEAESSRSRRHNRTAGASAVFQGIHTVNISGGNFNAGGTLNVGSQDDHVMDKELQSILDAIPNHRDIHAANSGRATEGTGPRFRRWREYRSWLVPRNSLTTMWGTGMPGAGKTIFTSIVINEVELYAKASRTPVCICYIYFRYSDHTTATVRDFLMVLIKQTIERHARCRPICLAAYERHLREKTQPSDVELLHILHRFSEVMGVMFYFLDALDEAPTEIQFDLLEKLHTLDVKLFITSRPLATLEACFPEAHRYPICAQDRDLDLHIAKEISRSPTLCSILSQGGPVLREKITSTIKQKCSGMFLHASLQLDALRGCANIYAVEKTLEDFPRQIEDVYQQTWKRIEAQAPETAIIAKNALVWVLCATRSLEIVELRHAIAACPVTHKFDHRRLVDKATLMGICRGLVNVEEGTNIVRFVHYTAKDVVKGLVSELSPYPHSLLALVCMALLTERGFQRTSFGVDSSLKRALKAKSLLAYAYNNWSTHAHKSLDDTAVAFQLSQFIQGCRAFPLWLSKQRLSATLSDDPFIDNILEPLHMVAYFDFPLSIAGSTHLRNPNNPTPGQRETPLMLSLRRKSLTAMRELLSLPGILVNVIDEDGNTPLIQAASCSEEGSLSLLLAHPKINVNAANFFGLTALMSAASEEETTLLLAHPKIKPNQLDPEGRTALMNASFHGRLSVVQALLADARVKINLKSKDGIDMAERRHYGDHIPYNEVIELLRTHSNREHFHSRNPLKNLLRRALPIAWKK
ncbi:hypothetical protein BKA70DRAFT_1155376 [Coprinopsis sp. MPI-PUGE-AT-0042]|nr:hypothetical protein BKA70DRAFT_1155376 [Coprinopsis sp. MPI-PUGE-AT-0042]